MLERELDLDSMAGENSAGPLPGAVCDRLRTRRRTRVRRRLGTGMVVAGVSLAAVVWWPIGAAPTTSPAGPKVAPVTLTPVTLEFDDPMFAGLDAQPDYSVSTEHWTIGSGMRGDWPSDL